MLSPAFTSVLRSGRGEFNRRFSEAKRLYPNLAAGTFSEFLQNGVDPLMTEVARVSPDRVADVAQAAYDVALELVGQRLAGPGARDGMLGESWRQLLPPLAGLIALEPARLLAALTNAVHHISSVPAARPDQWIHEMARWGADCSEVDAVLRLGQICGWRAGLAHFRADALALTDSFPEPVMLSLFQSASDAPWSEVKKHLVESPWCDPAAARRPGVPRVVCQAGTFRGFGGLFTEPPRVTYGDGQFRVRSGSESWLLSADLFGATFHRCPLEEFKTVEKSTGSPLGLRADGDDLFFRGQRLGFPAPGRITSAAHDQTTLAVTSSFTHSVTLVALT
jgi:hypothetical protein